MKQATGAKFEITIDGKTNSYRDVKATAMEAGRYVKSRNPTCEVKVRDLETGEETVMEFIPGPQ